MRARTIVFAGLLATSGVAALAACATSDGENNATPPPQQVPSGDAGEDAAADAGDADSCDDCEYFTDTCTDDTFCSNGPFDIPEGMDRRTRITVLRGRSESDVWVVGTLGDAAHFDGTGWKRRDLGFRETIRALWLRESGEIAGVSVDRLFSRGVDVEDGGTPSAAGWLPRVVQPIPITAEYWQWSRSITSGWGNPGSDWLYVTTEHVCFLDISNPTRPIPSCLFDTSPTSGLWRIRMSSSSPFEVSDAIGKAMCRAISCASMTNMHGASHDAFWAVGHSGTAMRVTEPDSDTPKLRTFNTLTAHALFGVWEATPPVPDGDGELEGGEAWAVGAHGTVRHYTGDRAVWESVADVPTTQDLRSVWGTSPTDVWAVGTRATVLHFDGTSWKRVKIAGLGAVRPDLTAVWSPSPGHVWIAGDGVVLSLGGKP